MTRAGPVAAAVGGVPAGSSTNERARLATPPVPRIWPMLSLKHGEVADLVPARALCAECAG